MALHWPRDGADWPHRQHSRFVQAAGHGWHVQHWPAPHAGAPRVLLLHGTGAATHTWRGLAPLLAPFAELLAPDLPGHAFTAAAPGDGASMHGMARGVQALMQALGVQPDFIVGHSAGAAVALRMALMAQRQAPQAAPHAIVALNPALFPLPGAAGALFSPVAKLLAYNPLVPHLFAWRAGSERVLQRLLDSTGSRVDPAGAALYRRIVSDAGHVAGALAMVSRWDLPALARELPDVRVPLHLVVGENDGTVPPADSRRAAALVPGATLQALPGLGHLAHEEDPQRVAALLLPVLLAAPAAAS